MRVGLGYDAHRLTKNRKLILGGVEIPFHLGLLGHSDADVLIHAITDALLGAAKLGDIGRVFPDTDKKYKDIASTEFLHKTAVLLTNSGYKICNIDAIIIAQEPKLSAYINKMEQTVANSLDIKIDLVNIKATTEEKMGFTGSGEGISAQAVCLLMLINP